MRKTVAIIGAGPSGLFAAEHLAKNHDVTVYDSMQTPARKLLIAGRGGLNLTHSEPLEKFLTRYRESSEWMKPFISSFTPDDLRTWCEGLGQETFIGTSGRIFPKSMKAVLLLRAWIKRLEGMGVRYAPRHYWQGWEKDSLIFSNGKKVKADITLLALGGASWPRLGSDGGWVKMLSGKGISISPLRPANSGFTVKWSEYFSGKFAGTPLKNIKVTHKENSHQGEAMITSNGIEGGVIYAISSLLRSTIENEANAILKIDLRPNMSADDIRKKLGARGNQSLGNYLRKGGFPAVASSLLREANLHEGEIAENLKNIPLTLTGTSGIERAISSAGGIKLTELDNNLMLKKLPGVYACGEMLDWEAPTGGYLLQACFSTAYAAAKAINGGI